MNFFGDRDGKSKTSSAVDSEHYPNMNGREEELVEGSGSESAFSHAEVQKRAYELWEKAGCPENTHEDHWREAEQQLLDAKRNRTDARTMAAQAGSVQR